MAKIHTDNISAHKGVEEPEPSYTADENAKWYNHLGKQFASVLQS